MKKQIVSLLLVTAASLFASGCLKDNSNAMPAIDCTTDSTKAPAAETASLKERLDSLHLSALTKDPRGFYYTMDSTTPAATDAHATPCSSVAVTYSIAKLGDTVFEKSDSVIVVSLPYTNVTGLRAAIPLMKKGVTMSLYLPPSLAYGMSGYKTIPGNTYVAFTIKLYDFSN